MLQLTNVVSDRGSKYAVSGGPVTSRAEADAFLKTLCRNRKFARGKVGRAGTIALRRVETASEWSPWVCDPA